MDYDKRTFLPWEVIAKSYFTEPLPEPEEPPKSKSVIFEDMEDDIEEESESEDESLPGINLTEEDDKVSITDLDEQKPPTIELPVMVEEVEKNPLDEIDSKVEETNDETLVLSL